MCLDAVSSFIYIHLGRRWGEIQHGDLRFNNEMVKHTPNLVVKTCLTRPGTL